MKQAQDWKPTKFVYCRGRLRGSRNRQELGIASRLIADTVAGFYDQNIPKYCRGRLIDLGCGKVPLYATEFGYPGGGVGGQLRDAIRVARRSRVRALTLYQLVDAPGAFWNTGTVGVNGCPRLAYRLIAKRVRASAACDPLPAPRSVDPAVFYGGLRP